MKAFPLGKIVVPTPGTRVQITADQTVFAAMIEFSADPAMAGATATVKDNATGTTIAPLLKPASGYSDSWQTPAFERGNPIRAADFAVDVATAGDGVFVTAWLN